MREEASAMSGRSSERKWDIQDTGLFVEAAEPETWLSSRSLSLSNGRQRVRVAGPHLTEGGLATECPRNRSTTPAYFS